MKRHAVLLRPIKRRGIMNRRAALEVRGVCRVVEAAAETAEVVAAGAPAVGAVTEAAASLILYHARGNTLTISSLRPERAPPSEFGPSFLRRAFFLTISALEV